MSYSSDESDDDDRITHPTQVYQRIYEREADAHFRERAQWEQACGELNDKFMQLEKEYKSNPSPELQQKMGEVFEQIEAAGEEIESANEGWINSYSVAQYYKDKERREIEDEE